MRRYRSGGYIAAGGHAIVGDVVLPTFPPESAIDAPLSGSALNSDTYNRLPRRPRRQVVEHPLGWAVGDWTTTDPVLAKAVARELDRVDPLPWDCPHEELMDVSDYQRRNLRLCNQCGRMSEDW